MKYHTKQDNISLIQIASGTEIGLFHIALHKGNTVEEILAPSLKKIIESEDIMKTGVCVDSADGSRLRKWFRLTPKGMFELSRLYRVLECSYLNTELRQDGSKVALSEQVEAHLAFPLDKGAVRTSDWSKTLDKSQILYAADDAYCGLLLYRIMEAKRLKIDPTPPRPDCETVKLPPDEKEPEEQIGEGSTKVVAQSDDGQSKVTKQVASRKAILELDDLDQLGKTVFDALCNNRTERATRDGIKPFQIASTVVLANVARDRPLTQEDLAKVKGVGALKLTKYGEEWLQIVTKHVNAQPPVPSISGRSDSLVAPPKEASSRRQRPQFKVPPPLPQTYHLTTPENPLANLPIHGQPILRRSVSAPETSSSPTAFEPFPSTPTQTRPLSCDLSLQVHPNYRRLHSALSALRVRLSKSTGKELEEVGSDEALKAIATQQPTSVPEICRTPGAGKLLMTAKSNGIDLLVFLQTQYSTASFDENVRGSPITADVTNQSYARRNPSSHGTFPAPLPQPLIHDMSSENRDTNTPPSTNIPILSTSETENLTAVKRQESFATPQTSTKKQKTIVPIDSPEDDELAAWIEDEINWAELSAN
jgi:ribonuclease D